MGNLSNILSQYARSNIKYIETYTKHHGNQAIWETLDGSPYLIDIYTYTCWRTTDKVL